MRIPAPAELQLQVNSCGLFTELGTLELAKEKNPAHQLFYFIQLSYFYLPKLKFTCTAVRADITSQKGVPQPFPSLPRTSWKRPVNTTWAAQTCLASPRNCLFPGDIEKQRA